MGEVLDIRAFLEDPFQMGKREPGWFGTLALVGRAELSLRGFQASKGASQLVIFSIKVKELVLQHPSHLHELGKTGSVLAQGRHLFQEFNRRFDLPVELRDRVVNLLFLRKREIIRQ